LWLRVTITFWEFFTLQIRNRVHLSSKCCDPTKLYFILSGATRKFGNVRYIILYTLNMYTAFTDCLYRLGIQLVYLICLGTHLYKNFTMSNQRENKIASGFGRFLYLTLMNLYAGINMFIVQRPDVDFMKSAREKHLIYSYINNHIHYTIYIICTLLFYMLIFTRCFRKKNYN